LPIVGETGESISAKVCNSSSLPGVVDIEWVNACDFRLAGDAVGIDMNVVRKVAATSRSVLSSEVECNSIKDRKSFVINR
jgi:hypothetical protein